MLEWKDLDVWKQAHELVLKVHRMTQAFPAQERFRLVNQMCRCAVSVPANIVEGHAHHTTQEYIHFLYMARGSAEEMRYHLLLIRDLGYLKDEDYRSLEQGYTQVSKMLNALISSLKKGKIHALNPNPKSPVPNPLQAVFLDRDGVINELICYPEQGIIDSPFTVEQFRLLPDVAKATNILHKLGFKVIVVSNQPGIAKGHMSRESFEEIREKMKHELAKEEAFLDGEYYCFHHPEAIIENLRENCECRKPKPGLVLQAAREMDIDLNNSWMIGDGSTDIKAGKDAGCRTILLGKMKCELCHLMDEKDARPDFIVPNLLEAAEKVCEVQGPKSQAKELAALNPGPRTSDIEHKTKTGAIERFEDIEA